MYRYGFNGKEKDDNGEWGQTAYDYGFRIYNPAIGKFWSVDPLSRSFPWWSPYHYAGNRPIDGIDLEGAEYITYLVRVYDGGSGAVLIDKIDYRGVEDFNYKKYSESFGPEGRGVKYEYQFVNEAGQVYKTETQWEISQGGAFSKSGIGRHGFFQGEGAKTMAGPLFGKKAGYDWGTSPIDEVDATAQTHDLNQEDIGTFNWLEDNRTLAGDLEAIESWDSYLSRGRRIDGSYRSDDLDKLTGRIKSVEALNAARSGSAFFGILTRYKQWKIGEMEKRGLDPNNVDHMKKVSIDDYKGKWYQFKRNAEQKILKAGSDAPK